MKSSLSQKIGLGSVQFGLDYGISNHSGQTSPAEVRRILEYAYSIGIDTIDTAHGYGTSEKALGEAGVDRFKVVTKVMPDTFGSTIEEQISESLDRLGVDSLYGILLHRPLDAIQHPEVWDTLQTLKSKKIAAKIGFSFNSVGEIESIERSPWVPDLIQVPFNYVDKRCVSYMKQFKNRGCEIHARSSFLQGLLLMKPGELGAYFTSMTPVLEQLQNYGSGLPGLLLDYCLRKDFIDKVIVGVNSKDQLVGNVESIGNGEHLSEMEHLVDEELLTPSNWPRK